MSVRNKVFISYCHQDSDYLKQLQVHLTGLENSGKLGYWVDNRIRVGENWEKGIHEGMRTAKVAVLLVSGHFLKSDYIMNTEVPYFLAAKAEGVQVFQVILRPVAYSAYPQLSAMQALNGPEKTVLGMTELEREMLWVKLTELIMKALDEPLPPPEPGLHIVRGSIVDRSVDALVIAGSRALDGQHGLEKTIHQAGGAQFRAAVKQLGGCEVGDAKWTDGGDLPARGVIHTVGPRWTGGNENEEALLTRCYRRSIEVARQNRCASLAFTSISTGNRRFPVERAAAIAIEELRPASNEMAISIVCTNDETEAAYRTALERGRAPISRR